MAHAPNNEARERPVIDMFLRTVNLLFVSCCQLFMPGTPKTQDNGIGLSFKVLSNCFTFFGDPGMPHASNLITKEF